MSQEDLAIREKAQTKKLVTSNPGRQKKMKKSFTEKLTQPVTITEPAGHLDVQFLPESPLFLCKELSGSPVV